MATEVRQIQNNIFGLGRSIRGISNDLKTRHKSRAISKLQNLESRVDDIGLDIFLAYREMESKLNDSK